MRCRASSKRGTGEGADIDRPAAGKTGTTQENVDAWFAGYVPGYAAVVWMGYADPAPMSDVHGRSVTGGSFPADIWREFMLTAVADRPPDDFPAPPDELLAAQDAVATSTSAPSSGDPGVSVTASGSGYETCVKEWYVTFDGEAVGTPETGSTTDACTATFTVPAGATESLHTVQAWWLMRAWARASDRLGPVHGREWHDQFVVVVLFVVHVVHVVVVDVLIEHDGAADVLVVDDVVHHRRRRCLGQGVARRSPVPRRSCVVGGGCRRLVGALRGFRRRSRDSSICCPTFRRGG